MERTPKLSDGRFVVCTTCNKLVDESGDAIDGTHTDQAEQQFLEMKYTDCNECKRLRKWRLLGISQSLTLSPLSIRGIMAAGTIGR